MIVYEKLFASCVSITPAFNCCVSNQFCNLFQSFAGGNKYNVKLLKRNESPNVPCLQKATVDGPCIAGKVRDN